MAIDFEKILKIMKDAALESGSYLSEAFKKGVQVQFKGTINLVTEADINSEKIIKEYLEEKTGLSVVGEESGGALPDNSLYFLVDPLDGTTNFSRRIPFYAVSIALMDGKNPVAGLVYLPEFGEVYYAVYGNGAYLESFGKNLEKLEVSHVEKLSDAVLATGFPYDVWENYEDVLSSLKAMLTNARALRRFGAAAVDLCYVARGIFDGFFELRLKPWDTAAGSLIVREAGGKVTDRKGIEYSPFMQEICATNGKIHSEFLEVLKKTF